MTATGVGVVGGRWSVVVDGGRRRQRRLAVTVGPTCGLARSYFVIAEVGSKFVHLCPGRGGAGGEGLRCVVTGLRLHRIYTHYYERSATKLRESVIEKEHRCRCDDFR